MAEAAPAKGKGRLVAASTATDVPTITVEPPENSVEEYEFSSEEEIEESDNEHDTAYYRDPNGAITVDSDNDKDSSPDDPDDPPHADPWRSRGLDKTTRAQWENMYCELINHPMEGDWDKTEINQQMRDHEMERYVLTPSVFVQHAY
jgi:hypothetical protein